MTKENAIDYVNDQCSFKLDVESILKLKQYQKRCLFHLNISLHCLIDI